MSATNYYVVLILMSSLIKDSAVPLLVFNLNLWLVEAALVFCSKHVAATLLRPHRSGNIGRAVDRILNCCFVYWWDSVLSSLSGLRSALLQVYKVDVTVTVDLCSNAVGVSCTTTFSAT